MNTERTFSQYLNSMVNKSGKSGRRIINELQEEGLMITRATFFNYLNGITIPKLDTAINILLYFDKSITKDEVQILINNSQREKDSSFIETPDNTKRHVYIKVSDEELLEERLINYNGNLTKYINDLVSKDLKKYRKEYLNNEI